MGSNSKTSHASYTVAPATATVPDVFLEAMLAGATQEEAAAAADAATGNVPATETAAGLPQGAEENTPPGAEPASSAPATTYGGDPRDVLTPIPDELPEGSGTGVPVLVGGDDLQDATATLISYTSGDDQREVLLATVNEHAEDKLLEALAVSGTKMIPIQVTEEINGRLPLDTDQQLYEQVVKAAKSVNHKLSQGIDIPDHTKQHLADASAAVQAVAADPDATADEKAMAAFYLDHLGAISSTINDPASGKVPTVTPYETTSTVKITKHVPAPAEGVAGLPAKLRDAGRLGATFDPDTGLSSWDGASRTEAHGKEYAIDLDDGYGAVYKPYAANDPAEHEFSLRGQLELHAPKGSGHSAELVRRLGQLHLVNRPMTVAEGEWTYLRNNITAQGLSGNAQVSSALSTAAHLEELQLQEIFHAKAHQAAGLDQAGLQKLAREFQLEAAAACLPKKVRLVRDAVAKVKGYDSGTALASAPGYDPVPRRSGGWLSWSRFDVAADTAAVKDAWKNKGLFCEVGQAGNLHTMFATGVMASTERRHLMGIKGKGMSEHLDKKSGGANSVFMRVRSESSSPDGPALVWDDPLALLRRSDYYAYNSDKYGSLNPKSGNSTDGMTRNPYKIAKHASPSNEIMFRHGVDLLGAEAPSRIVCITSAQRDELLGLFASRGITHLAGKPVGEVVKV